MKGLNEKLERMFYPKVVAVVGAKQLNNYNWLRTQSTFQGPVYHVNIDKNEWPGAEALGFKNFVSLMDIPDPVDYVVVSVPEKVVPLVLKDCIAKGVGGVHIFTAGFGETGTEEGKRLEATIIKMAQEADLPVIGPNCMGIFHPKLGIRQFGDQYHGESGPFGYISQSGSQAIGFSTEARANGLDISKSISFGNGTILDCTDFLEYLADDEDTKLIGMYLEGVKDGRRFYETLRDAARKKPVLVWKVGQTDDAARAGAFHSGSLAVSSALWDSMMRQCGAVKINSLEEMVDTAKVLLSTPPAAGNRAALIAVSGGHSSEMADVFSRAGFAVPPITEESVARIAAYSTVVGGSYHNPFEGSSVRTEENLTNTLGVIDRDPNIDLIAMEIGAGNVNRNPNFIDDRIRTLKAFLGRSRKPLITVVTTSFPYLENSDTKAVERRFVKEGIACVSGMERGARALRNAISYHHQRDGS